MHEWPDALGALPEELRGFTEVDHAAMNYTLLLTRSDAAVDALIEQLREQELVIRNLQAQAKYSSFTTAQCRKMLEHAADQFGSLKRTPLELLEDWRQAVAEAEDDSA